MLKREYAKIVFPLKNTAPPKVLNLYLDEFELITIGDIETIRIVFLNALKDYIEGLIDEDGIASLCFSLLADLENRKIIESDLKLYNLVSELADISWLSRGEGFNISEYKAKLRDLALKKVLTAKFEVIPK